MFVPIYIHAIERVGSRDPSHFYLLLSRLLQKFQVLSRYVTKKFSKFIENLPKTAKTTFKCPPLNHTTNTQMMSVLHGRGNYQPQKVNHSVVEFAKPGLKYIYTAEQ